MKKIFSLFAAILFVGSMFAAEESVVFSAQGYENGQAITSYTGTLFSVAFDKGTNGNAPKYYTSGSAIRCYGGNTFTVSSSESIVKIELTFGSSDGSNTISADKGTYSAGTWTGSATSVVFTIGGTTGNRRLAGIKVTTGEAPSVVDPVITGDAFFYDETTVTITCSTDGAVIYYTLDGSEPSASSTPYSDDFKLTETKTVKAIAIKGDDKSKIAEKTFTKNPSFASFDELIAAGLATNTLVEVSFANLEIDSIYSNKSGNRQGVYFAVNETKYEIYYSKVNVPEEWIDGGTISGTIRGNWTYFSGGSLWELVPSASDWQWTSLTYKAPTVVLPKIEIWGDWDDFTKHELTPAVNNKTASYTVELTEVKDYQFAFIYEESSYYLPTVKITRAANEAECDGTTGNATIEADATGEYTFTWTYATNTVTVTYPDLPLPKYTVTFDLGISKNQPTLTEEEGGAGVTLPAGPVPVCAEWAFAGWAEAKVTSETTDALELFKAGDNYKPAEDVTLYAVYKRTEVGAAPEAAYAVGDEGDFVLVANDGEKWLAIPANPTLNSGKITGITISVDESGSVAFVSADEAADATWTIAKSGDYYTLYDGAKYLYHSNGGNSGTNLAVGETASYKWDISSDENGLIFAGVNNDVVKSRGMLYSISNSCFGGYALSNKDGADYARVQVLPIAASTTYYFSAPSCWATSVDNTDATNKAVKFIENGQLFIEMNGRIYNVQGQTVK